MSQIKPNQLTTYEKTLVIISIVLIILILIIQILKNVK